MKLWSMLKQKTKLTVNSISLSFWVFENLLTVIKIKFNCIKALSV